MSKRYTGGPAFPAESVNDGSGGRIPQHYAGMTLRDYFAAKAMASMVAGSWPDGADMLEIASRAYAMADEMLKARTA